MAGGNEERIGREVLGQGVEETCEVNGRLRFENEPYWPPRCLRQSARKQRGGFTKRKGCQANSARIEECAKSTASRSARPGLGRRGTA